MASPVSVVVRWSTGDEEGQLVRVSDAPTVGAVAAIENALAAAGLEVPPTQPETPELLDARFVLVPTAGFGPDDPSALLAVDGDWTLQDLAQVVGRSAGLRLKPADPHAADGAYVLTLDDFRGFGEFAVNVAGALTLMRGVARTVHRFRTRQLHQLASGDAPVRGALVGERVDTTASE
ncbi:hypothetical protein [Microbacterium sp. LMI1-1-1.1]|uniref:hypothetical protein n=1 Tax=Microbacterium sp. LMI1-1-1.1 TaxID=3135223 RepID=UPI0034671911